MLTSYEQHLYEVLGKTQEKLKDEVKTNNYLTNKNKDIEVERNRYREYWIESTNRIIQLEKELKALQEKEEQDAGTPSPSAKVLPSGKTILKVSSSDVKEAV